MKTVLVIGVRRKCYKALKKLGHDVLLWSDGPLHNRRKKGLKDWLETPYASCEIDLSESVKLFLKKHPIDYVIANTEEVVVIGSRVRKFLGLKTLALDVVERFHNKYVMKNCANEIGIPITRYILINDSTSPEELIEKLKFPIVIKPLDDSGARDIKIARTKEDLKKFMRPHFLAEAFIDGTELSVETFIQNGEPVFHNITEYLHQWKKSIAPAGYPLEIQNQIIEMNDRVIKQFGVDRGMTHAEFYLTKNGPVFGEVAIRPPGGYYMELIQKVYSFNPWTAYVKLACEEEISFPKNSGNGVACIYMLHPGEGKIAAIHGIEDIKNKVKGIFEFRIRKKTGDRVSAHETTSNEVGHILFWAPTREKLLEDLNFIESTIAFEMNEI